DRHAALAWAGRFDRAGAGLAAAGVSGEDFVWDLPVSYACWIHRLEGAFAEHRTLEQVSQIWAARDALRIHRDSAGVGELLHAGAAIFAAERSAQVMHA